jgi:4-hydroxythreonine-4-phosphate dehydrogenase
VKKKPVIAITLGDPSGIGPEITLKALNKKFISDICAPLIIGTNKILSEKQNKIKSDLTLNHIYNVEEMNIKRDTINVISPDGLKDFEYPLGKVNAKSGLASYLFIKKASELAMKNKVSAIVTAPINKESIKKAGFKTTGHTEILAELSGIKDPLTMFQTGKLRIFFLSRHMSLKNAIDYIKTKTLYDFIVQCSSELSKLGSFKMPIAVAGLNPHNSDNGLFGNEEKKYIIPAIKKAVSKKIYITGPIPADSVFHMAKSGKYSAVISLYHDQGHIAAKTLDFERTVSVTLGMPFLRTSVDHGTAFDIAGKGVANSVSMEEAIITAVKYSKCH